MSITDYFYHVVMLVVHRCSPSGIWNPYSETASLVEENSSTDSTLKWVRTMGKNVGTSNGHESGCCE